MEIDLVYTYVDGNDPVWRAKRDRYLGADIARKADVSGACRYVQNDELRFSLRSAEKFAPWIRRIYIIVDEQTPAWLDTSNPRIRVVDHKEFIPADALPVFNSVAIEWAEPHLPGLAEHFLLANDDMFFGAPVGPEFFFAPDGYPYVRLKHKRISSDSKSTYTHTIWRAQQKIFEAFGKRYPLAPHHNIDAYRRSEVLACAEYFHKEVQASMRHRFRSREDLQRIAISYFALARGHAHLRRVTRYGSASNPLKWIRALLGGKRQVESRFFPAHFDIPDLYRKFNPTLFCLNDDERTTDIDRQRVRQFLEELFPEKSAFEK